MVICAKPAVVKVGKASRQDVCATSAEGLPLRVGYRNPCSDVRAEKPPKVIPKWVTKRKQKQGPSFLGSPPIDCENTYKLKQRLHDIKMMRNKISHCHDLEAREVYESLDNIQRFFETFKDNCSNHISQMKHDYVDKINK